MMNEFAKMCFVIGMIFHISMAFADRIIEVGQYNKVTENHVITNGQHEMGILYITSSTRNKIAFSLEVTLDIINEGDVVMIRNGVIEHDEMRVYGDIGIYVSSNSEDENLGHCVILAKFMPSRIVLQQIEECWWFGEGVKASGVYVLHGNHKSR